MPLRVQCSAGHWMMVPDHRAGTLLRCPNCGIDVQVPGTASGLAKPSGSAGVAARQEVRAGLTPTSRQSPQVAGHSTSAKPSGLAPATTNLAKPRTRPPPLPTAAKMAPPVAAAMHIPLNSPAATLLFESPAPPVSSVSPPLPATPRPATTLSAPEIVPPPVAPVAEKLPEPAPPRTRELETAPPPAKPSNRPRMTMTGTMISPGPDYELKSELKSELKAERKPEPERPSSRAALARTHVEERPAKKKPSEEPTVIRNREPSPPPIAAPPIASPPIASPPPAAHVTPPAVAARELLPDPDLLSDLALTVAFVPAAKLRPERAESLHTAATIVEPYTESKPADEPLPPPQVLRQGVRATASQRFTVWQLAGALLAALCLSIGPSVWEISNYLGSDSGPAIARWAFLLLMLGVVQFGCILLLIQIPDWSSVWIVTLMSLALAAIYAAVLGLTIITKGDSSLIAALNLDYQYSTAKVPPWCICLAATYACLAFFAGRISAKWRKLMKRVAASEQATHAAY